MDLIYAFGQQFAMTRDQTKRFLSKDSGIRERIDVLQDLLFGDVLLVADTSVTVRQRSLLWHPGGHGAAPSSAAKTLDEATDVAGAAGDAAPPASACGAGAGGTAPPEDQPEPSEPRIVRHVLRMEMALTPDRSVDDGLPSMRASPWQIVDWNWICHGNHPALKRGARAPW